jgi:hypothetical protein
MTFKSRCVSLGFALLIGAVPAMAQGRPLEIRVDMVSFQTSDGDTFIDLDFPGTLAFAFYFTPQFAIEPRVTLSNVSSDNFDGTLYGAGLFLPFYFKADEGKSGFFLAPGGEVTGGTGDYDFDSQFDYGLDAGIKFAVRERISTRFALTLRDGDSYNEAAFGATFGIGFHWR